jgi:hypothetical protein
MVELRKIIETGRLVVVVRRGFSGLHSCGFHGVAAACEPRFETRNKMPPPSQENTIPTNPAMNEGK